MASKDTKMKFVKGLAFGAVVGAIAALVTTMSDKDKKLHGVQKSAAGMAKKVSQHAMKLGKFSRSAYNNIVDAAVAELKGAQEMTGEEIDEIRDELMSRWQEVQDVFNSKKLVHKVAKKAKKAMKKHKK